MIGIFIFTHGELCSILRREAERLTGNRQQVDCLCMSQAEPIDTLIERVEQAIRQVDCGQGVIAFIDVAGGTPWNVIGHLKEKKGMRIRRISGAGIPVIIKALQDRGEHQDLDPWADELIQYAAQHVLGD
ncbi:MAG: hypothetical protein JW797_19220 [Bradymonadales bacterium]|nr:hypothetical protein [Bradymonadales bacterium]